MKIHLITGSFTPDINPRSFRTFELARQFALSGHEVTVSNLSYTEGYDYEKLEKELGIRIVLIPIYRHFETKMKENKDNGKSKINQTIRNFIKYYFGGKLFIYERKVSKMLFIPRDTNLVISISVPFVTHYAVANYRKRSVEDFVNAVFVADSGDPFSTCQQFKIAPYFRLLERRVLRYFDYLAIPTKQAINAYRGLIPQEKIIIIPQGFNLEIRNKFQPIVKNKIPTFAYAGVFYEGIRNPTFLFDYLSTLNRDFKFYLFLREQSQFIENLLNTYSVNLKNKISIHCGLKREELLFELRKMDFLINIANTTTVQVPSKIIDYAIVERPFISFNQQTFDSAIFNEFLDGDYRNADRIPDLEMFNIVNVANQFLSLVANMK